MGNKRATRDGTASSKVPPKATEPCRRSIGRLGFVEGVLIKNDDGAKTLCEYFGGISYALPPVGRFRWQRPRPLPASFRYGSPSSPGSHTGGAGLCPQPVASGALETAAWTEDCLQVNVWVPAGRSPKTGSLRRISDAGHSAHSDRLARGLLDP